MFFGLHTTDETVDLVLQKAAKDGGDNGGGALLRDELGVGRGVRQQLQQLRVHAVQQVAHELMGILLLVAPATHHQVMDK